MNGESLRRTATVSNVQGLHMRPITKLVELASRFQCDIYVSKDALPRINGKSAISLMTLAAEQGTELILEASGPDAAQALEALVAFIDQLPTMELS